MTKFTEMLTFATYLYGCCFMLSGVYAVFGVAMPDWLHTTGDITLVFATLIGLVGIIGVVGCGIARLLPCGRARR